MLQVVSRVEGCQVRLAWFGERIRILALRVQGFIRFFREIWRCFLTTISEAKTSIPAGNKPRHSHSTFAGSLLNSINTIQARAAL